MGSKTEELWAEFVPLLLGYEKHFGVPISEEQVDEMFDKIDLDGNGTIDYTEFVMATMEE